MPEISTKKSKPDRKFSQWLFNPFRFIAGYKAALLGLAIILASAAVGSFSNTHFDGVLDFHTGLEAPIWCFVAESLINWICMVIPLFFFGLIVSRSSFRIIDVLGTQALARWPYIITAVFAMLIGYRRYCQHLAYKLLRIGSYTTLGNADIFFFGLVLLIGIVMAIWMVALMYRAYTVSCNVKGPGAIITFIVALIGAEVSSKLVMLRLLG